MMGQFYFSPRGIYVLAPICVFHLKFFHYLHPVEQIRTQQETSGF